VVEIANKDNTVEIESMIISTVSWCADCKTSEKWLGNSSPKDKFVESSLWLDNKLRIY
jgi:hypothetical protein